MDEEKFNDLIQRFKDGEVTDDERVLVEKWLAHRSAGNAFESLSAHERTKIKGTIFQKLTSRMEEKKKHNRGRILSLNIYRYAAAVLLLGTVSYFIWQYSRPDKEQLLVASTSDQINKVILADGSIVWLKGNSKLIYPRAFTGAERNVSLTGEALFEVAKDASHPFTITTGGLTAKVLGTSFNIKTTGNNIEVLVLTGKVALSVTNTQQDGIVVLPNEKALFSSSSNQLSKVEAPTEESVQAVVKTEYSMNFNGTTMREVIRRIEGKFDVRILLANEVMNNCTITADFTDQSLEHTLAMIAQVLDFTYAIENNQVTVNGVGCE